MRVKGQKNDLAEAFNKAGNYTKRGGAYAPLIMSGVLCQASGSSLKLTGSDTEVTVRVSTEATIEEEGTALVDGRFASKAINLMPDGVLTLTIEDDKQLAIVSESGARFTLQLMRIDDYPELPEVDLDSAVELNGDELLKAIRQVTPAASRSDQDGALTGLRVEPDEDGGTVLIATDRFRMAVKKIPDVTIGPAATIPVRGLGLLKNVVGNGAVKAKIDGSYAVFGSEMGSVTIQLLDGNYPEHRKLLGQEYTSTMTVDRGSLAAALGRSSLVVADIMPVSFTISEEGIQAKSETQILGRVEELLDGVYTGEAKPTIHFNPRFLLDGLGALNGKEAVFHLRDKPDLPVELRETEEEDDNFVYLLMPVRNP